LTVKGNVFILSALNDLMDAAHQNGRNDFN